MPRALPLVAAALALLALAVAQHLWIAPLLARLPSDHAEETLFDVRAELRGSSQAPWERLSLQMRRVDQVLTAGESHAVLQSDLHLSRQDGRPVFDTSAIYGVDRRTGANLPGFGDMPRDGQFLFPPGAPPGDHRLWDSQFLGPREARFVRQDRVDGVPVHVFQFDLQGVDQTGGYVHLPEVPERFAVRTDGQGTITVEPRTGVVVDYDEQGSSYFVDRDGGRRVADFYHWQARFTPAMRLARLQRAAALARRDWLMATGLPAGLALAGLGLLAMAGARARRAGPVGPAEGGVA